MKAITPIIAKNMVTGVNELFSAIDYTTMPDYGVPDKAEQWYESNNTTPCFSLSGFSLSGQSKTMEKKMLTDRFVLDRVAILGQATVIYAKPNTGKTLLVLWMLIQSIKETRIDGKNVFYINADDSYKGLVFKTRLAEENGFEMLAPGHNGFEAGSLMGYMKQMIDDDTASGKVIILDTLKKFTDLMNKKTGSEFMKRAREFIANGGTLIMLAHTNKNRDADGKAVFGGTSDIVDDCDCAFILDEIEITPTTKQVLFENIKSRGDVNRELLFSYSIVERQSYHDLLESVKLADGMNTYKAKKDKEAKDRLKKDKPSIDAITWAIRQGITLKTEIVKVSSEDSGISRRALIKVLNEYTGTDLKKGDLWTVSPGEKTAQIYCLLTNNATASEYLMAKNGEYL